MVVCGCAVAVCRRPTDCVNILPGVSHSFILLFVPSLPNPAFGGGNYGWGGGRASLRPPPPPPVPIPVLAPQPLPFMTRPPTAYPPP